MKSTVERGDLKVAVHLDMVNPLHWFVIPDPSILCLPVGLHTFCNKAPLSQPLNPLRENT